MLIWFLSGRDGHTETLRHAPRRIPSVAGWFWNSGAVRIARPSPTTATGRWAGRFCVVLATVLVLAVGVGVSRSSAFPVPTLSYAAHVAGTGWSAPVGSGETAGTTGLAKAMEALRVSGAPIRYRAHVQGIGWQGWVPAGSTAGTTGRGLRMEALQVRTTAGSPFRVEYRAHVQGTGWQPWTSDGGTAGTTGRALRMEAVQVRLVPKGLRFTATADNGLGTTAQRLFAGAGRSGADLGLVVGDLSYAGPGSEPAYCSMVNSRVAVPTLIVAGNHEDTSAGHPTIENFAKCLPARVGLSGTYAKDYYVDRGPVRLILISPAIALSTGTRTYRKGTPEAAWLTTVIRNARAAGRWVVVGMHKPCLTLGSHGCASSPEVSSLLIREHVDLVLSGHDHVYARTHQVTGTPSAPVVVDRDGSYARGAGTVFTIVGNGGHEPRTVAARTTTWAAASGTNSSGGLTFGFGYVDATYSGLTFRLSRTSGGNLADSFTIRK